jgi:hypothetical protein
VGAALLRETVDRHLRRAVVRIHRETPRQGELQHVRIDGLMQEADVSPQLPDHRQHGVRGANRP